MEFTSCKKESKGNPLLRNAYVGRSFYIWLGREKLIVWKNIQIVEVVKGESRERCGKWIIEEILLLKKNPTLEH